MKVIYNLKEISSNLFFLFNIIKFLIPAVLLFIIGSSFTTVYADSPSYRISIENNVYQTNQKLEYFSLKMAPGATTKLVVKISNDSNVEDNYTIGVNSAHTSNQMLVNYHKNGNKNLTIPKKLNFSNITKSNNENITIAPHETKTVSIAVNLPSESFSGKIQGGIVIRKKSSDSEKIKNGIKNQYEYVVPVVITESGKIDPNLSLISNPKIETVNGVSTVTVGIANNVASLINNATVDYKIIDNNNKVILDKTQYNRSVAPQSKFKYDIPLKKTALKKGKYTLSLKINDLDSQNNWSWEKKFTVTTKVSKETQKNKQTVDNKSEIPVSIYVLLGILIVIIIFMSICLIKKNKK